MHKNAGLMKKKRPVWAKVLNLSLFLIFILFFPLVVCSYGKEPIRMEYSLKQLAGLYSESLIFGVKEDLIELNQIVHWGGTYKPQLKKEGNIIKIIFMQQTANSLLQTFNFTAKITNLERGKYKVQLIYPGFECLYEGSKNWQKCSKLEKREVIKSRKVFVISEEFDAEIK